MKLDISKPENLTTENIAKLLGSVDDSVNRQLRVNKNGFAYIVESDEAHQEDELYSCPIWIRGNRLTGEAAEKNTGWVADVKEVLEENWPTPNLLEIAFKLP